MEIRCSLSIQVSKSVTHYNKCMHSLCSMFNFLTRKTALFSMFVVDQIELQDMSEAQRTWEFSHKDILFADVTVQED